MKLIDHTARWFLGASAAVFMLAGGLLFLLLTVIFREEIDEQLNLRAARAVALLSHHQSITDPFANVEPITASAPRVSTTYRDTLVYDEVSAENEPYRLLRKEATIEGQRYEITLLASRLEWEDLFQALLLVFGFVILLLLVVGFFLQKMVARRVWRPFFQYLQSVRTFSIKQESPSFFEKSAIAEFEELRQALTQLTEQVQRDYLALKNFSENMAHELQTPLAIIQTRLDQVLQEEQLPSETVARIVSVRQAAERITRLSRGLALLARIENTQFEREDMIQPQAVIAAQIELLEEMTEAKGLKINFLRETSPVLKGNLYLFQILISNLMGNALRYATVNYPLEITLNAASLSFQNHAKPYAGNPAALMERFVKDNPASESTGLGLSLVKEIAAFHGWRVVYLIEGEVHRLEIHF